MKPAASVALLLATFLSTQASADPRDDVIAAFNAALAKQAYHVTTITQVRGKDYESHAAVQLPGSFHMTTPDSETIVMPRGSWMKMDGNWMKLPMDMSRMVENLTFEAMKNGEQYVQEVEATGSETIDGCAAQNYRYRTRGKVMGFKADSTVDLSVCQDTGLPIRLISTDAKGKSRSELRYDFNTPVEIHAPG